MLGVELLINEKEEGSKPDLNVATDISGGYSSGEENVKKSVKEDLNFFNEDKPSTPLSLQKPLNLKKLNQYQFKKIQ